MFRSVFLLLLLPALAYPQVRQAPPPAQGPPVVEERPARVFKHYNWWKWNGTKYVPEDPGWELRSDGYWHWSPPAVTYSAPMYHAVGRVYYGGPFGSGGGAACVGGR